MVLSNMLDVAIGLAFVLAMFSLIATAFNEAIESMVKNRGANLLNGIRELLGDPAVVGSGDAAAKTLYAHPLIQGLMRGDVDAAIANRALPSYLPPTNVARALIGQVVAGRFTPEIVNASLPALADAVERFRLAAERIGNAPLRRMLQEAADAAGAGGIADVEARLAAWYAAMTDRAAGWYKRRTQLMSFLCGLFLAFALNVNVLTLFAALSESPPMQRAVVAAVEKGGYGKPSQSSGNGGQSEAAASAQPLDDALTMIADTGLPIGWSEAARRALFRPLCAAAPTGRPTDGAGGFIPCTADAGDNGPATLMLGMLQILVGFLMTAFAVSLGAPFWFDLLSRMMVLRATVKPAESASETAADGKTTAGAPAAPLAAAMPGEAVDDHVYASRPNVEDRLFEDDHGAPAPAIRP